MNTHPAHFDYEFSKKTEFGKPLVVSPLTIALMTGMSVSDTSGKAIANLGWDEVRMTHPLFVGDTLYAESEVLEKRESKSRPDQGIVTFKTVGKNQDGVIVSHYKRTVLVWKRGCTVRQTIEDLDMATAPSTFHTQMDADEEAALLDAIQKWVDKEVRPVVQKYDHE